jgi:hypothetical protein
MKRSRVKSIEEHFEWTTKMLNDYLYEQGNEGGFVPDLIL